MIDLPEPLVITLELVVEAAAELQDPWWVFGGAAMALAGLEDHHVPDVDVMASPRDARRLIAALDGVVTPDPGEGLFRSRVFGQILTTPVPIDVMAEMDVRSGPDWSPVRFETRMAVAVGDSLVFIPSITEQIAVARQFGRPKDLHRAEALERLIA
ncbi:MAG TPA: hypothetical protein VLZ51_03495 [Brevundimonas sp.]|nr:hypothetical protein [Brevundimonas sp.]